MAARLKEMYLKEVAPALMKKYEYKSAMQIPKLEKIVINVGAGDAKDNSKVIDNIMTDLHADLRSEAGPDLRKEIRRKLQAPSRA